MPDADGRMRIVEDLGPAAHERLSNRFRARPVVVVSEGRKHGGVDLADDLGEVVEIHLAVANEVTADDDEVRLARIGHRDRVVLDLHRRDATDVQVGQVPDPYPFEVREKALGTCKPSNAKPARRVVPRVPLPQELLSKLPEPFNGGGSTHV